MIRIQPACYNIKQMEQMYQPLQSRAKPEAPIPNTIHNANPLAPEVEEEDEEDSSHQLQEQLGRLIN